MSDVNPTTCSPKSPTRKGVAFALSLLALGAFALPAQAAPSVPGFGSGGTGEDITTAGLAGYTSTGINCLVSTSALSNLCGPTYVGFGGQTPALFTATPTTAPTGGNFAALDGNPVYSGSLGTTISGLTIGTTYVLSFYQSADSQSLSAAGPFTESLDVTIGGVTTDTPSMVNNGLTQTLPWQLVNIPFTATATSESLSFLSVAPSGDPPFALLSSPTISLAVPEPSTIALFVSFFLGALGLRRFAGRSGSV